MPGRRRAEPTIPAAAGLPCPACGSRACALTGMPWCRHAGIPRDPDPDAAAHLATLRLAPPLIPLEAAA